MALAKPRSNHERRSSGCLARLVVLVLVCTGCYWLLLAPLEDGAGQGLLNSKVVDGQLSSSQQAALERLAEASEVHSVLAQEGAIRFLSSHIVISDTIAVSAQEKSTYFLKKNSDLFQLGDAGKSLRLESKVVDERGTTFIRYSQQHRGIPVYGSEIIVEVSANDEVLSVNATYRPNLEINTQPKVRSTKAETIALADPILKDGRIISDTRLVIYDAALFGSGQQFSSGPKLAWLVIAVPGNGYGPWVSVIDAHMGDPLGLFPGFLEALDREIWDAQGSTADPLLIRLDSRKVMDEDNHGAMNGITPDEDARGAWDNAAAVYNYYQRTFGRDSYDDKGSTLTIFVNRGSNCSGSSWSPVFEAAYFCPGISRSLDVMAHELTHGVYTSRHNSLASMVVMLFQDDSAALYESYSDVFAALIDDVAPWQITAQMRRNDGTMETILYRDLSNPSRYGYPDHISSRIHPGHANLCPSESVAEVRAGCPHANSTIPSYAAYLLAEGGRHRDISVRGISRQKLAYIYYDVMARRLPLIASFAQARETTLAACRAMIGQHDISTEDCDQVKNAFAAVGIGEPAVPSPTPIPPGWAYEAWLRAVQMWAREHMARMTAFLKEIGSETFAGLWQQVAAVWQRWMNDPIVKALFENWVEILWAIIILVIAAWTFPIWFPILLAILAASTNSNKRDN